MEWLKDTHENYVCSTFNGMSYTDDNATKILLPKVGRKSTVGRKRIIVNSYFYYSEFYLME